MEFESTIGGKTYRVSIDPEQSSAAVGETLIPFKLVRQENGRILFRSGTKVYKIDNIQHEGQKIVFSADGHFVEAAVKNEQDLLLEKLGFRSEKTASAGSLRAPMPGKILELLVAEGDDIQAGEPVAILEAMKMENELKAPATGRVTSVSVSENQNVEKNQPLLEIKPRG